MKLVPLLSGDKSLNPVLSHQLTETLKVFKNRCLPFIYLNIGNLLSKSHELRGIIKASNATVVGITELKLDDAINDVKFASKDTA